MGDSVIYEEPHWECPHSRLHYKLEISMTKNSNLRIDLFKWNLTNTNLGNNSGALDKFPLYTILPYETAKRFMHECDFDLEIFAKNYISI